MTEEEAEELEITPAIPIQAQTLPIGPHDQTASVPQEPDRINNVKQKESALHRAGVTRQKAFAVVAKALDAKKWADVIDRQGNVKQEWVDDLDKQRWAAEMVAKYFGDFVTTKETESNGIRQLVIIRPGPEAGRSAGQEKVERFSRPVHLQSKDVSGDVEFMGHGQDDVIDISGNAIQRANT